MNGEEDWMRENTEMRERFEICEVIKHSWWKWFDAVEGKVWRREMWRWDGRGMNVGKEKTVKWVREEKQSDGRMVSSAFSKSLMNEKRMGSEMDVLMWMGNKQSSQRRFGIISVEIIRKTSTIVQSDRSSIRWNRTTRSKIPNSVWRT